MDKSFLGPRIGWANADEINEFLSTGVTHVRENKQIETNGQDIVPATKLDPASGPRARCLANAAGAVLKARNGNYGDPEDNFETIAGLWTAYFKRKSQAQGVVSPLPFDRSDVALMTALIKVARLAQTPGHEDSWTDLAGYAACGLGCAEKDAEE